ncbi:MAG: hypothetical protein ABI867_38355 [Kofleriaceae bacterium]
MRFLAALGLVVALPSAAIAGPVSAGVSLGLSQSEADSDIDVGSSQTLGLWGRLQFSARVAGQLEVARYKTERFSGATIRTGSALLVVDLVDHGPWVPTLLAGIGIDESNTGFVKQSGHHIEGGFGLEYRAAGGLTIGADLRLGGRTLNPPEGVIFEDVRAPLIAPNQLQDGEYRSGRITVGVRF